MARRGRAAWTRSGSAPSRGPTRCAPGFARLLGDPGGGIALGAEHARAGGALPLRAAAPRAAAAGHHRRRVPHHPPPARPPRRGGPRGGAGAARRRSRASAERLAAAVDDRTAAVAGLRRCFFDSGRIAPRARPGRRRLPAPRRRAAGGRLPRAQRGAVLAGRAGPAGRVRRRRRLQVLPARRGQLLPARCRPAARSGRSITGWFTEFDRAHRSASIRSGSPTARAATGSPAPPTIRRATTAPRRSSRFFREQGLTPELLREVSQHQIGLLGAAFDALDLDPAVVRRDRGGPARGDRRLPRAPRTGRDGAGASSWSRAACAATRAGTCCGWARPPISPRSSCTMLSGSWARSRAQQAARDPGAG